MMLLCMAGFTSCSDYLDKEKSNEFTEEDTFSDWENLTAFHFDGYNYMRNGAHRIGNSWMDAATDLAMCSYSGGGVRKSFNVGNYYSVDGAAEIIDTWEHYYRGIRKMNTTLERIDQVPKPKDKDKLITYDTDKANYKAEARFLRAYMYWELFLRYGPVPVVTSRLDPYTDVISDYKTRPQTKDFIKFVMTELTQCEGGLMDNQRGSNTYDGRITKAMASALRCRIALYMASPRYAEQSGYTWDMARTEIDNFNSLYGEGKTYDLEATYDDAILKSVSADNKETIFWRNDAAVGWGAVLADVPTSMGGTGGNCPSQNLVDMYDMADGTSPFAQYDVTGAPVYEGITPKGEMAAGYNDKNPVQGRDPRLAATVLYNGRHWGYVDLDIREGGADNAAGDANATKTGYYMRKFVPETIFNTSSKSGNAKRNWIFIRYAEIILSEAEVLNEIDFAGNKNRVCDLLDKVRHRAGITGNVKDRTDLNTQEAMRNFIHKERTVEFAMEDHRAWDVRRWNCATEALARPIIGMTINSDGSYTRKMAQNRVFTDKMYLYPVPETEIWKTGMENNPGW